MSESYGLGFAHSLWGLWLGYYAPLSPWAWRSMLSLVGVGFALNLLWASRIVAALRRTAARVQHPTPKSNGAHNGGYKAS